MLIIVGAKYGLRAFSSDVTSTDLSGMPDMLEQPLIIIAPRAVKKI